MNQEVEGVKFFVELDPIVPSIVIRPHLVFTNHHHMATIHESES